MIKAKREKFGKFRRHLSVPTLFQADRIRDTFGDTNVRPNALKNTTDYNKRFTFSTLSLRE